MQESGYMDSKAYISFFNDWLVSQLPKERPLLLIIDGHKPHEVLEVIQPAATAGIHILCLPAHTSHLLQPWDKLFGPLKTHYRAAFDKWMRANINQKLDRTTFVKLITENAWNLGTTASHIKSGFKQTGILFHLLNIQEFFLLIVL
jgi:hypothetical protein